MKYIFSTIFYAIVLFIPLWLIGFGIFVLYVFSFQFGEQKSAEAIVAWTGGEYRIQTAINLLEQHKASKLLISGVNKTVNPDSFLGNISEEIREKIDLGYQATTTKGNALETQNWVLKNKFDSVILVTSFYHMPRSLVEFKRVLPNMIVIPYPIWPKDLTESTAWLHTRTAFHLINEYHKFLVIKLHYLLEDYAK